MFARLCVLACSSENESVTEYRQSLRDMTDDELSTEWVQVMVAVVEPDNRDAQLAAIDAVWDEINVRYENGSVSSLVITPEDALTVTKHLKNTIATKDSDWFGPKNKQDG
jgi:hypothetical protein